MRLFFRNSNYSVICRDRVGRGTISDGLQSTSLRSFHFAVTCTEKEVADAGQTGVDTPLLTGRPAESWCFMCFGRYSCALSHKT